MSDSRQVILVSFLQMIVLLQRQQLADVIGCEKLAPVLIFKVMSLLKTNLNITGHSSYISV